MVLTRKLSDLFVVGKEVTIDDGDGPVKVYIRKINPVDAEAAYRAANAAKSRAQALRMDPDDPMFIVVQERCQEATKDEMIDVLARSEAEQKRRVLQAELAAEDRWAEDDYLQGLYDAWEGDLKRKHFTDPDAESKRVHDEMEAFNEELEKRFDKELTALKKDLASLSKQKLIDKFFDHQFDRHAQIMWFSEYRKQELYHAVRDPDDHSKRAFESPEEIDAVENALLERLRTAYQELAIEVDEGKG